MSATFPTAIKAAIEGGGFGIAVFKDNAPLIDEHGDPALPPFGVAHDLNQIPTRTGDNKAKRTKRQAQLDIYQLVKNHDDSKGESPTLVNGICKFLAATKLETAPQQVWRCNVVSCLHTPPDYAANGGLGEIKDIITLELWTDL